MKIKKYYEQNIFNNEFKTALTICNIVLKTDGINVNLFDKY